MASENLLQFVPFESTLDPAFWHELGRRKLEKYQLSDAPVRISGFYTNSNRQSVARLTLDYGAFNECFKTTNLELPSPGVLRNTNTIDAFKSADKKALLEQAGRRIWEAILDGTVLKESSVLTSFLLLTHANLKKYDYYYWFAFPALVPDIPVTFDSIQSLDKVFSAEQLKNLPKAYDELQAVRPSEGFFLVDRHDDNFVFRPLSAFDKVYRAGEKMMLGFSDPSIIESNPGWPLRNFLVFAGQTWGDKMAEVDVLCYRDLTTEGTRKVEHGLLIEGVKLSGKSDPTSCPKVVGWERNEKNKFSPRFINLSANMDPKRLAESAVDLNLKLMRWRILPTLDLEAVSQTKCLLLGAGTLGCNVARCLLGWGIRKITLVDNSTVSYSNPVRQSLFRFSDCLNGGTKKAEAAAASLREIFPGVDATGHEINIPMPGHSVGSEPGAIEEARTSVRLLEELVMSHDAVFLLMDTRESRWLPTLLCATHSKMCVNAALGFDTFMIMRHAYFPPNAPPETKPLPQSFGLRPIPGDNLGCYFCSDVVAPTDSTRDRTLDQQCTVSRPGLSMIAAALVVELLVSVLQHPERGLAPASSNKDTDDFDTPSPLGLVPHQIRGFLSRFQNVLPALERFDKCTACSDTVISSYRAEGFEFLLKAFNMSTFLEDLTGLSKLYAETLNDHVWELSDNDSD